jgi:hypothetical protein
MKIKSLSAVIITGIFAGFLWMNVSAGSHLNVKSVSVTKTSPDSTIHWDKMDRSERMAYMKQVVFPAMKTEFAAFNPQKFGNMKCVTCHGNGALDDSYKMPNPQLWKFPKSKEGWAKADTNFMKFMKGTVKPKMASLLGLQPYDMEHKDGFGCGNCHTDED